MASNRCGIYLITHRESGKRYVGQSIRIDHRQREHASGKTGAGILTHAIAKHGWSAFDFEVLQICVRDQLNEAEIHWIAALGTLHPNGYNLTTGGQRYTFTDSVRQVISERTRAVMTPEWCAARGAKLRGVKKSAEHRAKISLAKKRSPENAARMKVFASNQSAETRAKIGDSNRGKKRSDEAKALISRIKSTPEMKARASAHANRHWATSDRTALSEAMKAGWERRRVRLLEEANK